LDHDRTLHPAGTTVPFTPSDDSSRGAGAPFARKAVHRGAAFGDLDNDGRVDAVVTALEGPLEIWRNVSPTPNHWLLVRTIGSRSNRDGMGARLRITTAAGVQYNDVNSAVGYSFASDPRAHFGLGRDTARTRRKKQRSCTAGKATSRTMALTMKDIAALARVSKPAASKVLNEGEGVSDETRARILRLIVRGSCGFAGKTGAAKEA